MKRCTGCGEVKPLDQFHRLSASRDGRAPECKPCRRARNRATYAAKRTEVRAQQAAYQATNRDQIRAQSRIYREKNRDRLKTVKREQYRRDPVAALAKAAAWKAANPERHRFLQRRSHLKRLYGLTPEQYDAMLAAQNGACALCATPAVKRLHVDHDHECCPGKTSCGKCIRGLLCGGCNRLLGWFDHRRSAIEEYTARRAAVT